MKLIEQAAAAKSAAHRMQTLDTATKNRALMQMAKALRQHKQALLLANEQDMQNALQAGKAEAFLDRLRLTDARIEQMAEGLEKIALLPDPTGHADASFRRPNGLLIEKRRVPIGVIGIIFEARPNVTSDAIGLCIKSGNACVLRGGSDAICSNVAVADCLCAAAYACGVPEGAIQLIRDTDRETANEMMRLNGLIDVLIPRGGKGLIRSVVENASIPVIETGAGVCHAYVDESADIEIAANVVFNGKCSRPSVCNALETLLVHKNVADKALPAIADRLADCHVELRCDARSMEILPGSVPALESDWASEYDDYIFSIKVVDSLEEAIAHINKYGTHHSDCIVTHDYFRAERFLNEVDSACVYVNASTRFTDGEEFGYGAEIGISTQMLHARGPMGLNELTTVKYVIRGNGQIR